MKELEEMFTQPNKNYPRVNILWRFLLLPIMIIWFLIQLFMFTSLSAFTYVIAIAVIFMNLGSKPEYRDWETPLVFILMPLVCPFIWWWRYFKFGEYNILIEDF